MVVIAILLAAGVTVELLCAIALLVMPTTLERLHYLGPAATLGPVLVAAAVCVSASLWSGAGMKAIVIALVLIVFAPLVAHAAARATVTRGHAKDAP